MRWPILLLVGLGLTGCGRIHRLINPPIAGSGTSISRTLPPSGATQLRITGPIIAQVRIGSKSNISITGDSNIASRLQVHEVDGELVIEIKDRVIPKILLRVDLALDALSDLSCSGAQKVEITGTELKSLKLNASRAPRIYLNLPVKELEANLKGASTIYAPNMDAQRAEVAMTGAARADFDGVIGLIELEMSGATSCTLNHEGSEARVNATESALILGSFEGKLVSTGVARVSLH